MGGKANWEDPEPVKELEGEVGIRPREREGGRRGGEEGRPPSLLDPHWFTSNSSMIEEAERLLWDPPNPPPSDRGL